MITWDPDQPTAVFDYSCMISGLSLASSEATVVVLQETEAGYRPVSLGLRGVYDRRGSVKDIVDDLPARLVASHFRDRVVYSVEPEARARTFAELADDGVGSNEVDKVAAVLGDSTVNHTAGGVIGLPVATADGQPLVLAFIAQPVWDALASRQERVDDAFNKLFAGLSLP